MSTPKTYIVNGGNAYSLLRHNGRHTLLCHPVLNDDSIDFDEDSAGEVDFFGISDDEKRECRAIEAALLAIEATQS
jgi:hypothetical protein